LIFVKDLRKDGDPASANWNDTVSGRNGQCITSLGKGVWGVCNKSFGEAHWIVFYENGQD
jgi:hypothetical protein